MPPSEPASIELQQDMIRALQGLMALLPWLREFLERMDSIEARGASRIEQILKAITQIAATLESSAQSLQTLALQSPSSEDMLRDILERVKRLEG